MHTFSSNGLTIDIEKLFSFVENIQTKDILVEELKSRLFDKIWNDERFDNSSNGTISPIETYEKRSEGGQYDYHYQKALKADLTFPIIIHKGKLIDGVHRLLKAYIQGDKTIKVVELQTIPEEAIIEKKPTILVIEASQESQQLDEGKSQTFYENLINFLEEKGYYVLMSSQEDQEFWSECRYIINHNRNLNISENLKSMPQIKLRHGFEFSENISSLLNKTFL